MNKNTIDTYMQVGKRGKVDPAKPRYVLYDISGYWSFARKPFADNMNDICDYAARLFAARYGLPVGKYHLQWSVLMRDDTYTRIYQDNSGSFRIVAEKIEEGN